MAIVVLTEAPFPFGLGATSRILSYSRGFVESGRSVSVFVLRPTASAFPGPPDTPLRGSYEGISYVHCSGRLTKPPGTLRRYYAAFRGLLASVPLLWRLRTAHRLECFILVSNSALDILFFFVMSRLLRVRYVQEKSEFPFVTQRRSLLGRLYAHIYTTYLYRAFDGLFVMTSALYEYFAPRLRGDAKLIVVPMTVEVDRFSQSPETGTEREAYVAYCGDMSGDKDGVDTLIEAFAVVAARYPDLRLYLVGDSSQPSEYQKLQSLVAELGLAQRVVFTGRLARELIPRILSRATVLALARPSTLQSKGGFPTKLGEYLSTGRPVVVTRVGELDQHLEDGTDVFFAEPDSHVAFAEKLDYVLSHLGLAEEVGRAGQEVARTTFDYKAQSTRLLDFIDSL